jgi:hypothetical protein
MRHAGRDDVWPIGCANPIGEGAGLENRVYRKVLQVRLLPHLPLLAPLLVPFEASQLETNIQDGWPNGKAAVC